MSEFASLLNSFKKNAAAASSSPSPPAIAALAAPPSHRQQPITCQSRKRPLSPTSGPSGNSGPPGAFGSFELSFLVIGGQKCGTTWLHTHLQQCPMLSLPLDRKEVHFWDWHYKRGVDWYLRQFGCDRNGRRYDGRDRRYGGYRGSGGHGGGRGGNRDGKEERRLYGEITPCYVILPPSKIAEIAREFPKLKIIFIARDLVDRAWSAMIMELRDQNSGLQPGEFASGRGGGGDDEKPPTKAQKLRSTQSTMSISQKRRIQQQSSPSSQPDSYYIDRLQNPTHDSRSNYAKYLQNWYDAFPSDSILILDYNDIERDPRRVLRKVLVHVGADGKEGGEAERFVEGLNEKDLKARVNAATDAVNASNATNGTTATTSATLMTSATSKSYAQNASEEMLSKRPQLKKQMENYLRPYAVKFNALLKDKGYDWRVNEY